MALLVEISASGMQQRAKSIFQVCIMFLGIILHL